MFGKLFGKKDKPAPTSAHLLSMPLFQAGAKFNAAAVAQFATKLDPSDPIHVEPSKDSSDAMSFKSKNATAMGALMPMPVPTPEVDQCTKISFLWPRDEPKVEHGSHMVLIAMSDAGVRAAARLATRIATTLMRDKSAVAWYVGNASLVHKPKTAIDMAESVFEDDSFPVFHWVNSIVSQDDDGTFAASTLGMEALGHREFEVVQSLMPPGELMSYLLDMASYVLNTGAELKHGQTLGPTAEDKWKIEIGKSKLGKEGKVIRIGVP